MYILYMGVNLIHSLYRVDSNLSIVSIISILSTLFAPESPQVRIIYQLVWWLDFRSEACASGLIPWMELDAGLILGARHGQSPSACT